MWERGSAKSLTVFLNGDEISELDRRGEPIRDNSFLLLFNAGELDLEFALPASSLRRAMDNRSSTRRCQ